MKLKASTAIAISTLAVSAPCSLAELIAHYKLDETSGEIVTEEVAGLNGEVSGGEIGEIDAIQSVPGINGTALSFAGDTFQRIDADSTRWSNLKIDPGYSVSCWLNWTEGGADNRSVALSITADESPTNNLYSDLGVGVFDGANVNADGSAYFRHRSSAGTIDTNPELFDSPAEGGLNGGFNDGEWHHIVGVVADGQASVYIDGIEVDLAGGPEGEVEFDSLAIGLLQRSGNQSDLDPFNGAIDDIQIYSVPLNEEQIMTLFQNPGEPVVIPRAIETLISATAFDENENFVIDFSGEPDTEYEITMSANLENAFESLMPNPVFVTTSDTGAGQAIVPAENAESQSTFYRLQAPTQ